jgi:putative aminopeptidase FrvX
VVIAFSVQEEFNVRGTLALATALRPAVAIGLDITPATDTPDLAGETPVRLGGGPVLSRLTFHGRGTLGGLVPDPALVRAIEGAASSAGLPLQYEAIIGVITDAAFLPMATPEGIATAAIGIPVRYTHSPVEMAALADVEATTQLLVALLEELPRVRLERGRAALNDGGMA